jgi:hypothetical protein
MYKKTYLKPILFGLIAIAFASCDKDYNELGTDIVGDEHFDFVRYTDASVKSYNQKLGPIATNNLPINALGIYDNPAFGSTKANFVTQIELSATNPTFNNIDPLEYDVNPTAIDSVILDLPYYSRLLETNDVGNKTYKLDSIYGVNESKFRLSVFQSNYFLRDLDPDQSLTQQQLFYSDQNNVIDNNKIPVLLNNSTETEENEEFFFDKREHKTKTFEADGVTPIFTRSVPSMRLHLRTDVFTNAILNAPTGQLADNATFKNYFRGLYFKTESTGNPGNMAMLNFKNGKVTIYYNEDLKKVASGVTSFERVNKTFALNLNGNTVSLLENYNENIDYLNAANNTTQEAYQLFLKGGQGSMAVIDIFGPDADNNGIADELEVIKANGWIVNEANLSFYVDKLAMSDPRTVEPNRIFLYDLTNKSVLIDYVFDFTTAPNPKNNKFIYGGFIEKEVVANGRGNRYKIKITNHVRNLIKNDSTNVRLGLSVTEDIRNVIFSRLKTANSNTDRAPSMSVVSPLGTILYGSSPVVPDNKRLKLEIYYTKPE